MKKLTQNKYFAHVQCVVGYGFFGDAIRDSEAKRGLGIARYAYGSEMPSSYSVTMLWSAVCLKSAS